MPLTNLLKNLWSIFYPKLCVNCGRSLIEGEDFLCLHCVPLLSKTNYHRFKENPASDRLLGKASVERATSYLYYSKGGIGQKIITEIKYRGNIPLGKWIGMYMAKDISSDFFEKIDYIVPVPLHLKKLKKRGFNQSEIIAQGISSVTGIPLETKNLYRNTANTTQTKKGVYERWKNTSGIFNVKDVELFSKKHILLIDDVLTTGATLDACINALMMSSDIQVSFLTIAIA